MACSRVLVECLFLLLPPFLCVAWSCAAVDKKEHTVGAVQLYSIIIQLILAQASIKCIERPVHYLHNFLAVKQELVEAS